MNEMEHPRVAQLRWDVVALPRGWQPSPLAGPGTGRMAQLAFKCPFFRGFSSWSSGCRILKLFLFPEPGFTSLLHLLLWAGRK